jgi:hypothetical protein
MNQKFCEQLFGKGKKMSGPALNSKGVESRIKHMYADVNPHVLNKGAGTYEAKIKALE